MGLGPVDLGSAVRYNITLYDLVLVCSLQYLLFVCLLQTCPLSCGKYYRLSYSLCMCAFLHNNMQGVLKLVLSLPFRAGGRGVFS